jgi:hypothetical protein
LASRLDPPEKGTGSLSNSSKPAIRLTHGDFVLVAYLCDLGDLLRRLRVHYGHGEPVDVDRRHLREAVQAQLLLVGADSLVSQDISKLVKRL